MIALMMEMIDIETSLSPTAHRTVVHTIAALLSVEVQGKTATPFPVAAEAQHAKCDKRL
jgi:hypothetical protein